MFEWDERSGKADMSAFPTATTTTATTDIWASSVNVYLSKNSGGCLKMWACVTRFLQRFRYL